MSQLIDVQDENDIVWTMHGGVLLAWQVQDGFLAMVDAVEAMKDTGEALVPVYGSTSADKAKTNADAAL